MPTGLQSNPRMLLKDQITKLDQEENLHQEKEPDCL
jgi:hypothetical protein